MSRLLQFPKPFRGNKFIDRLASDSGLRTRLRALLANWSFRAPKV